MTADVYRISVELPNGAKFRAQGEASEVRLHLDRFYALLIDVPKPTNKPINSVGEPVADATTSHGSVATEVEQPVVTAPEGLDRVTLDRLFAKDKNGTVSLRALPHGDKAETDALVALIYGSGRLGDEQQVTGSRLMKAAQQSGLHQVDRIDRSLAPAIGPLVTTAGFKKGRRYGLTNPGIRRAEEILIGILG